MQDVLQGVPDRVDEQRHEAEEDGHAEQDTPERGVRLFFDILGDLGTVLLIRLLREFCIGHDNGFGVVLTLEACLHVIEHGTIKRGDGHDDNLSPRRRIKPPAHLRNLCRILI